jgi:hypothetical protein
MNPGDEQLCAQSELQGGESLVWSGAADPSRSAPPCPKSPVLEGEESLINMVAQKCVRAASKRTVSGQACGRGTPNLDREAARTHSDWYEATCPVTAFIGT